MSKAVGCIYWQRRRVFLYDRPMRRRFSSVLRSGCIAALAALMGLAQTNSNQDQISAAYDTHKSEFDYLLGDWEFTATSQDYGKLNGRWSAVRLDTGQILDEYRVLGPKGETYYVTTTIRAYNPVAGRWELLGMDRLGGLQDFGTAQRVGAEMHIEQKFGVAKGNSVTLRIRYYNIGLDRFSWSADQSTDGGKTWVKEFRTIEARRIGPPRTMGPLTAMVKP